MLQILIADDHALLRKGLQDLLQAHAGWRVCAEATDGRQAVVLAEQLKPDVAIVDQLMPELNGVETTRRIRGVSPGTAVLVLAGSYSERIEEECIAAGARGFVLKTSSEDRVIAAIELLVKGETSFVCDASRRDASRRAGEGERLSGSRQPAQAASLTSRELETVQLLAEGKTNWCIATILGISVRTVETHRANVMHKLGLQSVVELVHYAVRNRMVETLPAATVTPLERSAAGGR